MMKTYTLRKAKKFMIECFSALFIGFCIFLLGLHFFQHLLIYHPDRTQPSAAIRDDIPAQDLMLQTTDGLTLKSWFTAPTQQRPIIIFFHGNAGNIAERGFKAKLLHQHGYGVLLVEYRGFGGNKGIPSEKAFYQDAKGWMNLIQKTYPNHKIVFYGESIGTGTATEMAYRNQDAAALILETPFASLTEEGKRTYPFLPVKTMLHDRYDNQQKIVDIHMPVLILHGTADETIPYEHAQKLYKLANEPKKFATFPNGMHSDLYQYGAFDHILKFLKEL
jgi:fermentation-respiration switch protein FrsA (DUF1100 family)